MTDGQMTFRVDPRIEARIEELVKAGACRNKSEFVIGAILLRFELERIPLDVAPLGASPLEVYFDSPRGREVLREVLCGGR